jgi:hypothetical protein
MVKGVLSVLGKSGGLLVVPLPLYWLRRALRLTAAKGYFIGVKFCSNEADKRGRREIFAGHDGEDFFGVFDPKTKRVWIDVDPAKFRIN